MDGGQFRPLVRRGGIRKAPAAQGGKGEGKQEERRGKQEGMPAAKQGRDVRNDKGASSAVLVGLRLAPWSLGLWPLTFQQLYLVLGTTIR